METKNEKWEYVILRDPDSLKLNDYGRLGWEICAAATRTYTCNPGVIIVYLKRRVQEGGAR